MPLTIEAKVAATMQVFVMPAVRMRIEALGTHPKISTKTH